MLPKNFMIAYAALICIFIGLPATSQERPEVVWGGLAISSFGNSAMAPVAQALLNCSNPSVSGSCAIEDMAKEMVLDADFEKISVKNTYAEDRGVNYLISTVIDAEMVTPFVLEDRDKPYVYQFLVLGSLVIYEVSSVETSLLASVPIAVYADRYYRNRLSQAEQADVIKSMYLELEAYEGDVGYYNFFSNLIRAAEPIIDRPLKFGSNVKFTHVGYSDEVAKALSSANNLDDLSTLLAVWATANLAKATGQPIIPAALGKNKLKLVFRDAETTLVLPKPFYEFDMHVQAVDTYKNSKFTCFDVAAYYGVKVDEEMALDAPVQHGEDSCAFLQGGTAVPAEIYPANLLAQVQQVMFGFSPRSDDRQYIRSHIVQDRESVLNGFKNIREKVFNGG